MASADSHHPIPTPLDVSSTRQVDGPPKVIRAAFMLMPVGSTSWRSVQVLGFTDICLLTPPHRLYPLPVRQASILPAASFRFHLAMDTLAVQLTFPLAGYVKDFHLQVTQLTTTVSQVALSRSAPCLAHISIKQPQRLRLLVRNNQLLY